MTKVKRFAALAAVAMLGIQIMGAGTAFAKPATDTESECDFGTSDLEITLGNDGTGAAKGDVTLFIDADGNLDCDADTGDDTVPVSTIDSITVEMDDDDMDGELTIVLNDGANDASEWPEFDTFDINVTTQLHLDGEDITDEGANRLRVVATASTLSFSGTEATYSASSLDFIGGEGKDSFDGTKATVRIYADGDEGNDLLKGGSGKDELTGGDDVDILYGNGGNDDLVCGGGGGNSAAEWEQGWGGADSDYIEDCNVVAPGSGDDDISNTAGTYTPGTGATADDAGTELVLASYGDLTKGIEWDDTVTGGEAGDDYFDSAPYKLSGSAGDDVIFDSVAKSVSAGAGDDVVKVGYAALGGAGNDLIAEYNGVSNANLFYGNAGDDVLRGKAGDDSLFGGPGKDQAWGASGSDTCRAEVMNRCDYGKI